MPELPEAEYMVRRLTVEPGSGVGIARTRVLRESLVAPQTTASLVRRLRGRRIEGYSRRAKNVLIHLDNSSVIRIQLGMTGHVYAWAEPHSPPRFTRVLLELTDGRSIVFEDARTFGCLHCLNQAELATALAEYGPEPLDPGFAWSHLRDSALRSRIAIKPFLLDQSKVVGLGNIWAAEALWEARLDPWRSVAHVTDPEWKRLHTAIGKVLTRAIEGTFAVTKSAEQFPEADLLSTRVYGREGEPCPRCRRSAVERRPQAGRSTFYCAQCQS